MAGLVLVTKPIHEPVDLVEMKEFLRVTSHAEDHLISQLIKEAREHFDGPMAWFNRALVTATWDYFLDCFPVTPMTGHERPDAIWQRQTAILVPLPPLQSVTSITYVDVNGAPQTLAPTEYVVDTKSEPGELAPAAGKQWPVAGPSAYGGLNSVTIRFVAGYGTAPLIPEAIKTWIKIAVAYRFDNRSQMNNLPNSFFWSLANYKTKWAA
jgi:hypothetical protein